MCDFGVLQIQGEVDPGFGHTKDFKKREFWLLCMEFTTDRKCNDSSTHTTWDSLLAGKNHFSDAVKEQWNPLVKYYINPTCQHS